MKVVPAICEQICIKRSGSLASQGLIVRVSNSSHVSVNLMNYSSSSSFETTSNLSSTFSANLKSKPSSASLGFALCQKPTDRSSGKVASFRSRHLAYIRLSIFTISRSTVEQTKTRSSVFRTLVNQTWQMALAAVSFETVLPFAVCWAVETLLFLTKNLEEKLKVALICGKYCTFMRETPARTLVLPERAAVSS